MKKFKEVLFQILFILLVVGGLLGISAYRHLALQIPSVSAATLNKISLNGEEFTLPVLYSELDNMVNLSCDRKTLYYGETASVIVRYRGSIVGALVENTSMAPKKVEDCYITMIWTDNFSKNISLNIKGVGVGSSVEDCQRVFGIDESFKGYETDLYKEFRYRDKDYMFKFVFFNDKIINVVMFYVPELKEEIYV